MHIQSSRCLQHNLRERVHDICITGSNPASNKNLVIKWRKVEGRVRYPTEFSDLVLLALGIFSVIKKKELQECLDETTKILLTLFGTFSSMSLIGLGQINCFKILLFPKFFSFNLGPYLCF